MKRYEELAEDIAQSIRTGVLKPGDRLPSVRQTSGARGVSPATVFAAYYRLEAAGLIRARERSGYFVALGGQGLPPEPALSFQASGDSTAVDVSELVFEILGSVKERGVIPFGSAFPSPQLFPLARLAQSLARSSARLDPWSTVDDLAPGRAELRRQIALRYLADGMPVHTDELVITNGAMEALNLCLLAVARPGDSVVVEAPAFYGVLQALERQGLRAIEVPTHPREGIDLDALAAVLARHQPRACLIMTSFQNPLGSCMRDERKQALVDLLATHGVPLIEDDVYGELYFGSKRPLPAKAFDRAGLVMHCGSFSKSLAPGYRIGWVAPGRYTQEVARLKLTTTISTAAPLQAALADYLSRPGFDKHLRQLRHALAVQQSAMMQALLRHFPKGTTATRPTGGYFLWVELPGGADALAIQRQALAFGISVAPGPIFSARREFAHCLRLNYGHPWTGKMDDAMEILGRLARSAR